jgi:dihydrofolate reductase
MTRTPRTWSGQVFIATSVDGFIARPDGDIDWLTDPPAQSEHAAEHPGPDPAPDYDGFIADVTHLVMGRGTYEKVLTFDEWPYGDRRVIVISTSLAASAGAAADERVTVVPSVEAACALLTDEGADRVYVDGGRVISAFLERDLIDELVITRAPIVLGEGLPLFHALPRSTRLVHLGTSTIEAGMVSSRYRVERAATAGGEPVDVAR